MPPTSYRCLQPQFSISSFPFRVRVRVQPKQWLDGGINYASGLIVLKGPKRVLGSTVYPNSIFCIWWQCLVISKHSCTIIPVNTLLAEFKACSWSWNSIVLGAREHTLQYAGPERGPSCSRAVQKSEMLHFPTVTALIMLPSCWFDIYILNAEFCIASTYINNWNIAVI